LQPLTLVSHPTGTCENLGGIGVAGGKVVVRIMKTAILLKWAKTEQELQHIDCPQISAARLISHIN